MSAFAADLEVLQAAISRMAGFGAVLSEHLDQVDARAGRLQASWSGTASTEYGQAHRHWLRGAREMHAALEQMRLIAAVAHGNYGSAMQANQAMWP